MNPAGTTRFAFTARSHAGMSGKNNEDRFAVGAYETGRGGREESLVAVLSDGIGGHRAGEVAAQMAVDTLHSVIGTSSGHNPTRTLQEAVQAASRAIHAAAQTSDDQAGMGATCAIAWAIGERLFTATVGDSRVYLMRQGQIFQLSTDHTWVQEALEQGRLQRDEMHVHPNAHVIRRYLGSPIPPEADLRQRWNGMERTHSASPGLALLPGDRVLLCSDGLTDLVEDGEILDRFQNLAMDAAVDALIELANSRGGHDNTTLMVFEAPARLEGKKPLAGRRLVVGCLAAAALLLFAGLAAGAAWYLAGKPGLLPTTTAAGAAAVPDLATREATTCCMAEATTPTAGTPLPAVTPMRAKSTPPAGGATLTAWPTNTLPSP